MLGSIIDTSLIFTGTWKETKLDYNHSVKSLILALLVKLYYLILILISLSIGKLKTPQNVVSMETGWC